MGVMGFDGIIAQVSCMAELWMLAKPSQTKSANKNLAPAFAFA